MYMYMHTTGELRTQRDHVTERMVIYPYEFMGVILTVFGFRG